MKSNLGRALLPIVIGVGIAFYPSPKTSNRMPRYYFAALLGIGLPYIMMAKP